MKAYSANMIRVVITAFALILELAHLGWEHLHGGVVAHHVLNQPDMPAISNWWGVLLIPALTWFVIGRVQRRISKQSSDNAGRFRPPPAVLAGFLGALAYGVGLALAFSGNHPALPYIFMGLFAVSLLVPAYRAEYVLGFVLGMTFTFGAVIPTVIAMLVATISGLAHFLSGTAWRLVRKARAPLPPNAG